MPEETIAAVMPLKWEASAQEEDRKKIQDTRSTLGNILAAVSNATGYQLQMGPVEGLCEMGVFAVKPTSGAQGPAPLNPTALWQAAEALRTAASAYQIITGDVGTCKIEGIVALVSVPPRYEEIREPVAV